MTKNSSSKAAIAQIRTRLSAVGIEMNYSTALRLYDAAGEGPRRITKAMAIGIVDHSVNTADGLEDTADRTSRRFEPGSTASPRSVPTATTMRCTTSVSTDATFSSTERMPPLPARLSAD